MVFEASAQAAAAAHPIRPDTPDTNSADHYGLNQEEWNQFDVGNQDLVRVASHRGTLQPTHSRTHDSGATSQPLEVEEDLKAQAYHDVEAHSERTLRPFASQQESDQILVHWEGPDDPENPRNWNSMYK